MKKKYLLLLSAFFMSAGVYAPKLDLSGVRATFFNGSLIALNNAAIVEFIRELYAAYSTETGIAKFAAKYAPGITGFKRNAGTLYEDIYQKYGDLIHIMKNELEPSAENIQKCQAELKELLAMTSQILAEKIKYIPNQLIKSNNAQGNGSEQVPLKSQKEDASGKFTILPKGMYDQVGTKNVYEIVYTETINGNHCRFAIPRSSCIQFLIDFETDPTKEKAAFTEKYCNVGGDAYQDFVQKVADFASNNRETFKVLTHIASTMKERVLTAKAIAFDGAFLALCKILQANAQCINNKSLSIENGLVGNAEYEKYLQEINELMRKAQQDKDEADRLLKYKDQKMNELKQKAQQDKDEADRLLKVLKGKDQEIDKLKRKASEQNAPQGDVYSQSRKQVFKQEFVQEEHSQFNQQQQQQKQPQFNQQQQQQKQPQFNQQQQQQKPQPQNQQSFNFQQQQQQQQQQQPQSNWQQLDFEQTEASVLECKEKRRDVHHSNLTIPGLGIDLKQLGYGIGMAKISDVTMLSLFGKPEQMHLQDNFVLWLDESDREEWMEKVRKIGRIDAETYFSVIHKLSVKGSFYGDDNELCTKTFFLRIAYFPEIILAQKGSLVNDITISSEVLLNKIPVYFFNDNTVHSAEVETFQDKNVKAFLLSASNDPSYPMAKKCTGEFFHYKNIDAFKISHGEAGITFKVTRYQH
jgi:hypothetical protein